MIGYAFDSIGLYAGDLLLFAFSLLTGVWLVATWKRGSRFRAVRWVRIGIALLALVPLVMLGWHSWRHASTHPPSLNGLPARRAGW